MEAGHRVGRRLCHISYIPSPSRSSIDREMFSVYCAMSGSRENINKF